MKRKAMTARYGPATFAVALDTATMLTSTAHVHAHHHVGAKTPSQASKVGG